MPAAPRSEVELMFGRGTVAVAVPAGAEATVVEKPPMPLVEDPAAAVAAAVNATAPASDPGAAPCRPLMEVAAGAQTAA